MFWLVSFFLLFNTLFCNGQQVFDSLFANVDSGSVTESLNDSLAKDSVKYDLVSNKFVDSNNVSLESDSAKIKLSHAQLSIRSIEEEKQFNIVELRFNWALTKMDSLKKYLALIKDLYSSEFIDSVKLNQPFYESFTKLDFGISFFYPHFFLNSILYGVTFSVSYLNQSYKAVIRYIGTSEFFSEKKGVLIKNYNLELNMLYRVDQSILFLNNYDYFLIKYSLIYSPYSIFQFYQLRDGQLKGLYENKFYNNIGHKIGLVFYKKFNRRINYSLEVGYNFYTEFLLKKDNKEITYNDLYVLFPKKNVTIDFSGIYFSINFGL